MLRVSDREYQTYSLRQYLQSHCLTYITNLKTYTIRETSLSASWSQIEGPLKRLKHQETMVSRSLKRTLNRTARAHAMYGILAHHVIMSAHTTNWIRVRKSCWEIRQISIVGRLGTKYDLGTFFSFVFFSNILYYLL